MKKSSKSKNKTAAALPVDPYLDGLMAKLLDRLAGLERKMDIVIAQTGTKPSGTSEAPKPFQNNIQMNQEPRRKDRVLYEAICADCRSVCEVPFKPSEGRAVYCKDCFAKRKSGGAGHNHNAPRSAAVFSQPPAEKPGTSPTAVLPVLETSVKSKKSAPAKKTKKKK